MVPDDGVSVVPVIPAEESDAMSVDLSPNVANQLLTETVGNLQITNRNGRDVANSAIGMMQLVAASKYQELDAAESRATSGILATPLASPTVQSGQ